MPTRRRFLQNFSTAALAATLVPASGMASHRPVVASLLNEEFSASDYAAQLQSLFLVTSTSGQAVRLHLVEVRPVAPSPAHSRAEDALNDKFTLIFSGPKSRPLEQNTYGFAHARLGRREVFIVPVAGADARVCYYAAAFNRPRTRLPGTAVPGNPTRTPSK